MAAITTYTTLAAAINTWDERSHDADELIGLAEGEFRLYLGPNYAKQTSSTLSFTSGSATLPTGFVRAIGLTHATYGALKQRDMAVVRERRVWDVSGIPDIWAILATTVETAPTFTGDATFDYEGTLTGLSSGNASNWLLATAPQAYLSMCMSYAKAKFEDYQTAALLKANALRTVDDLVIQATVGQHGRAGVNIPGPTP